MRPVHVIVMAWKQIQSLPLFYSAQAFSGIGPEVHDNPRQTENYRPAKTAKHNPPPHTHTPHYPSLQTNVA